MSSTERERMKGEDWEGPAVFPLDWLFIGAWKKIKAYFVKRKMRMILKNRTKRKNLPR